MSRSLEVAAMWVPERFCAHCLWIRDYCGRYVCYAGGQVGRTVRGDEDATFCQEYEEAVR
ncbi:MAG: hypothetical protein ABIJ47_03965 [Candidatus Bathyarchaeota archaeon]